MPIAEPAERPWHLIPVALLAVLWHAGGSLDYLLTQIGYEPYLSQVPPDWLAYFDAMPGWVTGAWALAVWGGLAGALLLLARLHWAPFVLAVAFFAVLAATVWLVFLATPPMPEAVGMEFTWVMVAAVVVALFLWLYARHMRRINVIT
jgi:hypothetical protein